MHMQRCRRRRRQRPLSYLTTHAHTMRHSIETMLSLFRTVCISITASQQQQHPISVMKFKTMNTSALLWRAGGRALNGWLVVCVSQKFRKTLQESAISLSSVCVCPDSAYCAETFNRLAEPRECCSNSGQMYANPCESFGTRIHAH